MKLNVPILLLDKGGLPPTAKWYWHRTRDAQIHEVQEIFGDYTALPSYEEIEQVEVPSIVIVPTLAGGCVSKRDWWSFRRALRQYRARGGIVVVLGGAFCLPETGQKSSGRNFEGIYTSGGNTWLEHPVHFSSAPGPVSPPTHGFWVEHRVPGGPDSRIEVLETASDGSRMLPLVIRFADRGSEMPGAMLFMTTWGWMRERLLFHPRTKEAKLPRADVEATFGALRMVNRRAVESTITWVLQRMGRRLARLETLSGEGDRLVRRMGSEKDYQRLLANDFDLCLDVLSWRALVGAGHPDSESLRREMTGGWLWPEPPHHKGGKRRGRLDLLLLPKDEGPATPSLSALELWLAEPSSGKVAWVELEAGGFDATQMDTFYDANKHLFRDGDFIAAVDRSPDDSAEIQAFANKVSTGGYTFVHVRIPEVFDKLEEHYAPLVHRALRKRFTTEVIRGLIG